MLNSDMFFLLIMVKVIQFQTYPPQFFLISCLLDWVITNGEGNLSAACVGALAYTSPEEFNDNNKAYSHLLKLTAQCINVIFEKIFVIFSFSIICLVVVFFFSN